MHDFRKNLSSNSSFLQLTQLTGMSLLGCLILWAISKQRMKRCTKTNSRNATPPVRKLTALEQYLHPQESYIQALKDLGPIFGVPRNGTMEYFVSPNYVRDISMDKHTFLFAEGSAVDMHLQYYMRAGSRGMFGVARKLVEAVLATRMREIALQVISVTKSHVAGLKTTKSGQLTFDGDECFYFCQQIIAHVMLEIFGGKSYATDENVTATITATDGVAKLFTARSGNGFMGRNFSLPFLSIFLLPYVLVKDCIPFFLRIGKHIWSDMNSYQKRTHESKTSSEGRGKQCTIIQMLLAEMAPSSGVFTLRQKIETLATLLFLIFGSIHTSAVTSTSILYKLAQHPDYVKQIREETGGFDEESLIDVVTSSKAEGLLDAFVRETIRMRGDIFSGVRKTSSDVTLGGFAIKKGTIIRPLTIGVNRNSQVFGESASIFDPSRWLSDFSSNDEPISNPKELGIFGHGYHICPGRKTALAAVKLIAATIINEADLSLATGNYEIANPLYMSLSPPCGTMVLKFVD